MPDRIIVALAGNPNSGKTTVFNNLTGAHQHVGNYPGVTVEKKEGICTHNGVEMRIVDLPGTYSLTAHSVEELIARNFVIEERPDVVVDILDASNLERNLYLATQFMELGAPLVLALNMSDLAEARGYVIDKEKLSELLGVPMVSTVGHKAKGMNELLDAAIEVARSNRRSDPSRIRYGREIEEEIVKIESVLRPEEELCERFGSRWLAVKLLENDEEVKRAVRRAADRPDEILAAADRSGKHILRIFNDYAEIVIADRRYGFISGACRETVKNTVEMRHTASDRIDSVVANRVLGLPIFFLLMYLVFNLTFTLGEPPMHWIEAGFAWLARTISMLWPKSTDSVLRSFLVDGIIGGVGGVIVFLPNILLLFLAIAFLEDTGYMARAAFVMDKLMHKIGLHGKSFIPMLIGFGCSVPGIMATRVLENRRDRLTTMLILPLMSCGARLPIYALFIPAFFPVRWRAPMLLLIYLLGICLAAVCAKLLRSTLLRGKSTTFVMELPPYRMPTLKGILIHMWERGWLYLKKAGTIILGVSVVLWALTTYPKKTTFEVDYAAERAAAERTFYEQAKALNPEIGLKPESETLVRLLKANADLDRVAETHYRREPAYLEAKKERDRTIEALKKEKDYPAVAGFMKTCEQIKAAREGLTRLVSGPEEVQTGRVPLKHDLRRFAPEGWDAKMLQPAFRFLDEIEAPFKERLAAIRHRQKAEELSFSMAGRTGHAIEPVLKPLGFDWRIGTALIGAVAAKEVFVAQMGIVFAVGKADEGDESLREKLRRRYTPLTAFCIMLFCLVSAPCMATFAVTKRESNSWNWALLQFGGLTALAYTLTLIVQQVGRLIFGG